MSLVCTDIAGTIHRQAGRLTLAFAVWASIASFPVGAQALTVAPPGNSGINQYTETYPTAGGNTPSRDAGKRSPKKVLGPENARRLQQMGPEGRAAALLAAQTAPERRPGGRKSVVGAAGLSGRADTSGSSGFRQVLGQVTGTSSDSAGMGALLPLMIVLAALGGVAYALTRRRNAQSS